MISHQNSSSLLYRRILLHTFILDHITAYQRRPAVNRSWFEYTNRYVSNTYILYFSIYFMLLTYSISIRQQLQLDSENAQFCRDGFLGWGEVNHVRLILRKISCLEGIGHESLIDIVAPSHLSE